MQRAEERVGRGGAAVASRSLVEAVWRNVAARGEEVALASKGAGGSWVGTSYVELWRRVERLAAGLASLGVGAGDRVALMSRNRPEWPVVDLAAQSLGAVVVTVYPTLEVDGVRHILADSGAVVAVAENEEMLGRVQEARADLPGLRHLLLIEGRVQDGAARGAARVDEIEDSGAREPLPGWEEGWRSLDRDDVATVIYTSGTTGPPKGAVLTHGNILSNVEATVRALPLRADDVFLSFLPLSHVFERTCGQFIALSLGASIYYAESIEKVPENLREVRPTVVPSVPRLYEKMYDRVRQRVAEGPTWRQRLFEAAVAAGRERYELELAGRPLGRGLKVRLAVFDRLVFKKTKEAIGGRLRFFVAGGAKLEREIGEFFYAAGVTILEGYGLTETSPTIACNRMPTPRFGTVGVPLDNVEVRISGEGEVQVRGPSVMRRYWNNEEATRKAFTEDGWYKTGDIGEIDEAGCLRITDRLKNIIVLSTGKNVAPAPIEAAIAAAPHVSQAVLFGDDQKYVAALVVPDYEAVRETLVTDAADEELARDALCLDLVQRDVEEACSRFAAYERPKKLALLSRELSHEAGELTPKLSVKLRVVKERYAKEIAGLYA